MCSPQQNVLFPSLTVREHLNHFGSIKGLYGVSLRQSVKKCIDDVGLTDKEHTLSKNLSGGMKRKLCLALALIGDPKFVLLDEVSSRFSVVNDVVYLPRNDVFV